MISDPFEDSDIETDCLHLFHSQDELASPLDARAEFSDGQLHLDKRKPR